MSTTEARQKTSDNDSLKQSSSTPAPSEEQPTNVLDNESCHKSSGESLEESSSKPAPSEEQPTNVSENDSCNNNSEDSLQHNTSIPEPSQKEHTKSPVCANCPICSPSTNVIDICLRHPLWDEGVYELTQMEFDPHLVGIQVAASSPRCIL